MKKIGRYEIVEELGRGSMGVVYKASDPTIGRLVAIKLLLLARPSQSGLPGVKDIFLREARAAGRLSHPGIVTVHDALEDPETQSCYIVMEFVPGRTLEKALLAGPPLRIEQAVGIARQIGEALEYAHGQKIIHRDLKPANILLTEDNRAKITDFGIAKVVASDDAQRTLAIMGTPAYMSPEQVTGGEIDASSDLFSLGILLYLMLTGEKPFSGDTAAVMFKIAYQDPAPPSQIRSELSRGHDFVLLRALVKDKKKRYASAREFLDDLDDVEQGRAPRSEARVPMSELHAGDLTIRASRPLVPALKSAPAATPKKSPTLWIAGAGMLIVLLAAGGWFVRWKGVAPPPEPVERAEAPPPPPPSSAIAPPATASAPTLPAKTEKAKAAPSAKVNKGRTAEVSQKAEERLPHTESASAQNAVARPIVPTPVPTTAFTKATAPAAPSASVQTLIQLHCDYRLEEAKLTISADNQSVLSVELKGKKRGKLFGLEHSYSGVYSRPVRIASGFRSLTVHLESKGGSLNLTKSIAPPAANGKTPTLHVTATPKEIELHW